MCNLEWQILLYGFLAYKPGVYKYFFSTWHACLLSTSYYSPCSLLQYSQCATRNFFYQPYYYFISILDLYINKIINNRVVVKLANSDSHCPCTVIQAYVVHYFQGLSAYTPMYMCDSWPEVNIIHLVIHLQTPYADSLFRSQWMNPYNIRIIST